MTDTDQKKEDEVLRRMLKTKPKPHKEKGSKPKPAPFNVTPREHQ